MSVHGSRGSILSGNGSQTLHAALPVLLERRDRSASRTFLQGLDDGQVLAKGAVDLLRAIPVSPFNAALHVEDRKSQY